ncbi:MAG TPA: heparan-alpha-glucosaminide N-acetyltransferase, partial [Methanotrichaceae archaeon]|nr:heparan-alpha-glucosaminide N-acetyltransferase [Methanotrichaceae archaeon]
MSSRSGTRFWELDMIRGLAAVMMVLYHMLFDLSYLGGYNINVYSGFWLRFAQATASIFIVLAGISLAISRSRAKERGQDPFPRILRRGLWIFSLGMVITFVTYALFRDEFIIFGVLHFLGVSIVLAYPFLGLRFTNLIAGIGIISAGLYLQGLSISSPWLLWLGMAPKDFYTLDYFPLIPWFGLVLIGVFLGNELYGGQRRRAGLPDLYPYLPVRFLDFLGRNSLAIYLIHQPALIIILY